jgi:uncharacterized membrane-anchored protein YhcB (DUF1043 family)
MTQLNPFTSAILPSAQAQQQQNAERVSHVRRSQEVRKNSAARPGDLFEHQVESSEELTRVHDEGDRAKERPRRDQPRPQQSGEASSDDDQDQPRLDITV